MKGVRDKDHFETLQARAHSLISCSLSLEDQECLVYIAEQVEENNIPCLVCDCGGVALADDHVPACALVFQVWIRVERLVYGCRGLLVQLVL